MPIYLLIYSLAPMRIRSTAIHGHNRMLGKQGEDQVCKYLISQGGVILERNWRIKEGEIDVIAKDKTGVICFVEVKTRSTLHFGHPCEAIDAKRLHRMQRLALAWLATHSHFGAEYRIDCAALLLDNDGQLLIDYRADI